MNTLENARWTHKSGLLSSCHIKRVKYLEAIYLYWVALVLACHSLMTLLARFSKISLIDRKDRELHVCIDRKDSCIKSQKKLLCSLMAMYNIFILMLNESLSSCEFEALVLSDFRFEIVGKVLMGLVCFRLKVSRLFLKVYVQKI
ncbi:hypothetical protein ALC53_14226 [Atta colombica]|uniref:Uncharacterized protein n=1 Tax=Atta colombica TaxID=520822 RepID=A0A195AU29_9HYME|nr:hypothetical protein ALC53_14226 [Atta colombica]